MAKTKKRHNSSVSNRLSVVAELSQLRQKLDQSYQDQIGKAQLIDKVYSDCGREVTGDAHRLGFISRGAYDALTLAILKVSGADIDAFI